VWGGRGVGGGGRGQGGPARWAQTEREYLRVGVAHALVLALVHHQLPQHLLLRAVVAVPGPGPTQTRGGGAQHTRGCEAHGGPRWRTSMRARTAHGGPPPRPHGAPQRRRPCGTPTQHTRPHGAREHSGLGWRPRNTRPHSAGEAAGVGAYMCQGCACSRVRGNEEEGGGGRDTHHTPSCHRVCSYATSKAARMHASSFSGAWAFLEAYCTPQHAVAHTHTRTGAGAERGGATPTHMGVGVGLGLGEQGRGLASVGAVWCGSPAHTQPAGCVSGAEPARRRVPP
jgi:hypothetical protein